MQENVEAIVHLKLLAEAAVKHIHWLQHSELIPWWECEQPRCMEARLLLIDGGDAMTQGSDTALYVILHCANGHAYLAPDDAPQRHEVCPRCGEQFDRPGGET